MSGVHPSIEKGWFTERSDEHFPGQGFSLRVERILYHSRSEYQNVLVFESTDFGNVLVLDGIIQCTERDEFAYQEMIAHIPLFAHGEPKNVLVIGGGDGGVIREVVKHTCVEKVTLVEIDKTVIDLSQKYLPGMSCALNNSKVEIKLCDGFQFLREAAAASSMQKYDVIITDSSDPEGPAEAFFQKEYFELLKAALNPGGIVIAQASENVWLNIKYLKQLMRIAHSVFDNSNYCYTTVPSYTSGQLGLIICSNDSQVNLTTPRRIPTEVEQAEMRYYNADIHQASFILPTWADRMINHRN
ncbi:ZYBA0S03-12354g1_1 [Zygosaccharomyces bailii CLIB 213]|uniref:ZYBA0S03-12354g1_1 n=1 Tax=Zygosaccharomyces bailii (strain CLIB 213 / ATCC 58445 / CBS 680 / BCRC 21525 / NBRC 1098 / NCYC 1416 / NRRL Y-2227) TaxID=1333698 RepID=A0A8J2T6A6_ZYGB2|nr:ZYBA0S03-12354g1_1 [Zygosaccharomyces bailii CLIB 213]